MIILTNEQYISKLFCKVKTIQYDILKKYLCIFSNLILGFLFCIHEFNNLADLLSI